MYEMGDRELAALKRVLKRRSFFRYGGVETDAFEKEWAKLVGARYATAVTSGTAALIVSLKAMGIGPGDSVLVPGYTFISTALAVTAVGAIPIYTEIDETLTMCPADIEKRIRKHTTCIIPVHMQGLPCDMKHIMEIAGAHGILVLEDCCQAVGGSFGKKRLGTIGDMGAFSFNQYKIITCGEGGVCVTSNRKYAERAYMAQDGSCSVWPETGEKSEAFFCGGNFRTNEFSTAVMREQARRLDGILRRLRRSRAAFVKGIELPAGYRFVPSNDEKGDCGVCFLVQAETVAGAERLERAVSKHIGAARAINSGRHVYSAWGVISSKAGGHHRQWDCFKHPKNRGIRTNYRQKLRRTDDYLARTVLCSTPYELTARKTAALIDRINRALGRL